MEEKKKICIVGGYSFENFGDELTYYSLYLILKKMGYEVRMVPWPRRYKRYFMQYKIPGKSLKPQKKPVLFRDCPYEVNELNPVYSSRESLVMLNKKYDIFIVGSGQYFHSRVLNNTRYYTLLDWVEDDKTKIAYSAAWGNGTYSTIDKAELEFIGKYIRKFTAFSVREKNAVLTAKELFSIEAKWVMDPVFLCSDTVYQAMSKKSIYNGKFVDKSYVFAYMLDLSQKNCKAIANFGKNNNLDIITVCTTSMHYNVKQNKLLKKIERGVRIEDWLYYIDNCEVMITDSFHGLCVALILNKPFVVITRPFAGNDRYISLLETLGLKNHIVENPEHIEKMNICSCGVNYLEINKIIAEQSEESLQWLKSQIEESTVRNECTGIMELLDEVTVMDEIENAFSYLKERIDDVRNKFRRWTSDKKNN